MIWDNHACLPMQLEANLAFLPQLARYRRAGVDVVSLNVGYGEMSLEEHLRLLAQMRAWILARPSQYKLVSNADDAEAVQGSGVLGVVFDVEGAAPLAGQLEMVDVLHVLGVRWLLLAYNKANPFGAGCHEAYDEGLTAAGAALLDRMARVGMTACLSHTGYRTARDALRRTTRPLVFTHSNPRALQDHPRNIPDALIIDCAETGGVIGVNGLRLFLGGEGATALRLADHIDYIAQLVGVDHVGLGLDYVFDLEGLEAEKQAMLGSFPAGLGYEAPTTCFPPEAISQLGEVLAQRGYDSAARHAVLGGNWLRIARTCWRPDASGQS
jgi:membrane dipeptidase